MDKVCDISVYKNNFSSRGSTVMVQLLKSVSQLSREIYREKKILFNHLTNHINNIYNKTITKITTHL